MVTQTVSAGHTDGRSARATRTREAVVAALLALLDEGDLRPTAREIASRAGVSLRSVYVHFDDLEDLFCAAARQQFAKMAELIQPLSDDGPLDDRLDAFVEQRARVLETGNAVRRAAVLQAPFSPTLARVLEVARRAGRGEVERVFASELGRRPAEARARLVAALAITAGAATWDGLRTAEQLDVDEAGAVVRQLLRSLLVGGDDDTPARRRTAGRAAARAAPARRRI
ncbi:MAG TPA: TetR/AcrR family transcriptional regulator [Acidimicrobiia bacterium]|jgi:AcrR family transcriptional regulator